MNKYNSEFLSMLKLQEDNGVHSKSFVTWRFASMFFEQLTSACFTCKNWTLRDKIKTALNKPSKTAYFHIRDLYQYTDTQIEYETQVKDNVIDYFAIDSKNVMDSIDSIGMVKKTVHHAAFPWGTESEEGSGSESDYDM